jgi:hypothetical protein
VASGSIWDITLPRYCWQKVLALLTPAESALRRLIIMAAHGKPIAPFVPEEQAARTEGREVTSRKRLGLMRGGSIPGYIHKGEHDIHDLLLDVHNLAWDCLSPSKYRLKPG